MSDPAAPAASSHVAAAADPFFDQAPCGLLTLAPDGAIIRVNSTLSRWLCAPASELLGRRFRDILTVPGRIFYETNVAPLLRLQDGFEEVALDLVDGAGVIFPVLVNALVQRDADGALQSIGLSVIRSKARRRYERDLQGREAVAVQQLQDEQAASQLREQFIAVLGHDLRNPLASIVGAARLLRREVQSEKATRVIGLMETSVDRMAGLIDNVMDFARGRLGSGIDIHRTVAPLEPVLRQIVEELEASQPSREILCDLAVPDPISFDASRMGQLVSNLLANALTHGDPRQPVKLRAFVTEGILTLWVANAGTRIPDAAMAKLFQPFFRGEIRPSQQGLGLGLHIASEIAKAHAGTLAVVSDEIETRFTLLMPVDLADS